MRRYDQHFNPNLRKLDPCTPAHRLRMFKYATLILKVAASSGLALKILMRTP